MEEKQKCKKEPMTIFFIVVFTCIGLIFVGHVMEEPLVNILIIFLMISFLVVLFVFSLIDSIIKKQKKRAMVFFVGAILTTLFYVLPYTKINSEINTSYYKRLNDIASVKSLTMCTKKALYNISLDGKVTYLEWLIFDFKLDTCKEESSLDGELEKERSKFIKIREKFWL